ncbi:hypothetical protein [Pseudomonas savastanoi]|uniref:Uncharacterized protein n=1 Tax=Pseudomonas savastanoi pv. glycinea TaxID=318 RepID=A0A3M3IAU9_PSESG|nr:hypothetical protein [Pseudomonas savastanoi]EFW82837.1 hypothetical protein PsgRace4_27795 [Pseudomonas savastanoi pv. glycinea str. race 4]MCQ3008235.1 hypothetical protein [Pseudomonas savastanoi]RMM68291.1 hypothetical protein ALQ73_200133 [Pseudomonas savastanoi pv. glycinea]RMM95796.1 hypothetical protein ALQ70_200144 [Pseudomonas savastanoi pv. glycinea]RMO31450.1 hypothetical protein ALQ42_200173 [Pseudomonas savastanoi pv. glycinea]
MRVIKASMKVFAVVVVASIITRTLILSGLVRAGLETSSGRAIYLSLHDFFNAKGIEDAETMVIFVVLLASLLLVSIFAWSLSKLVFKNSSKIKKK